MSRQWFHRGIAALVGSALLTNASSVVAQSGSFLAVLNEATSNADSRRSVEFFDANDLGSGPMFSVFVGYERDTDYEDPNAIDVDPNTGDIYFTAFDSGASGTPGTAAAPNPPDTLGDMELYKISFATVYSNWVANYKGKDVRSPLIVGGIAPTGFRATTTTDFKDYVTYGVTGPNGFDFDPSHSNTVVLADSVSKIGEVKRNLNPDTTLAAPATLANGQVRGFFPYSLSFIDQETLVLVDDSSESTKYDGTDDIAKDHEYRVLQKVGSLSAADTAADNLDGGFDRGTSQLWKSTRAGTVALDAAGHSEVESSAAYTTPSGIKGVWVSESDGQGDDIAFRELNLSGAPTSAYRGIGAFAAPSFALDNDPAVSTSSNDGKADNIMVDLDTGDVLIIESGFGDTTDGIGLGDIQPSVLRARINTYEGDGSGGAGNLIEIGSWDAKVTLNPTLSPGATGLIRGQFTAWDSVNDRMYFVMPGATGDTPSFETDIWALDLKVGSPTYGQTFSYLEVDNSLSLFTTLAFGDKVAAFTLGAAPVDDADFDNDNDVDGNDFLIWQRGFSVGNNNATGDADGNGVVDGADLAVWKSQFGAAAAAAVGSVPEPATLAMGTLGCLALAAARRRR